MVTVLDHDTLRSDDFEGEAFLALKAVPGVGGGGGGDEADGHSSQPDASPAQMRLPLMHPKPHGVHLKTQSNGISLHPGVPVLSNLHSDNI